MSSFRPAAYRASHAYGGRRDSMHRRLTFVFEMVLGPYRPLLYANDYGDSSARPMIDERVKIVYPASRMVVDGRGRNVAREHCAPNIGGNDLWLTR